jgi:hypothetical protein
MSRRQIELSTPTSVGGGGAITATGAGGGGEVFSVLEEAGLV